MIGKRLSPVLEEIEATLWEFDAQIGAKPEYSIEGFRAAVKIFISAVMDKMWEKHRIDNLTPAQMEAEAERVGHEVRAFVMSVTGIDTTMLYNKTEIN